jgi:hypothetical protein
MKSIHGMNVLDSLFGLANRMAIITCFRIYSYAVATEWHEGEGEEVTEWVIHAFCQIHERQGKERHHSCEEKK